MKRVVGLEGETLSIHAGIVFINGQRLHESYQRHRTLESFGPYDIPQGFYFVMGDNRLKSEDSRHFGAVARSNLTGRVTPGKLFAFY